MGKKLKGRIETRIFTRAKSLPFLIRIVLLKYVD
jgi:hypothetical protein